MVNEHTWRFALCPEAPEWRVDWEAIRAAQPWLDELINVPQDPQHHAEGDVHTHTRMVAEALAAMPAWRALPETERHILFLAALLHDIGKPICTQVEANGRIISQRHARVGATIARQLLWVNETLGAAPPLHVRETIVALVRLHGLPIWFLDRNDMEHALITSSYRMQAANLAHLALLAEADARGRICADQNELLGRIELFRGACAERAILTQPYPFASPHSRVRYCRSGSGDPNYHAYDTTWGEVIVMVGLPGAGKDHWLNTQALDLPIVSLDAIRQEKRIDPTKPQGIVASAAKEQARVYLRRKQPFIWNATNLTRMMRDPLLDLLLGYDARVRLVYCDAPLNAILTSNHARQHSVPENVVLRLASKFDMPDLTEAHALDIVER